MFANARSVKSTPEAMPRGIATFRVYLDIAGRAPGIYSEAVMGAYRKGNGEAVVVIQDVENRLHVYKLNRKAGYAQIVGRLPEAVRPEFELARPGESFFVHSERLKRLDRDEIAAEVFAMPVWYGGYGVEMDSDKALRIPFNAKMFRRPPMISPVEMMQRQLAGTLVHNPVLFQDTDENNEEMGMR